MAISAATVFEVRTTGADTNGGAFVAGASGTDYSQQDAAQFSGTDLVIDGTTNTKVTSVTHNFVATDVGNIIQITAGTGFTTGFFQIVSVASNAATLDRSAGTLGSTGGTWAEGGALASPGIAIPAAVAQNTVWIKATATYSISSTANVAGGRATSSAGNLQVRGYGSTRGDGTKPTLQATGTWGSIVYILSLTGNWAHARDLTLDANSKTNCGGLTGSIFTGGRMSVVNLTTNGNGFTVGDRSFLFLCSAAGTTAAVGFNSNGDLWSCTATGLGNGFLGASGPSTFHNCVAASCTTGIKQDSGGSINCVAYNCTTGYDSGSAANGPLSYYNCVAYGCTASWADSGAPTAKSSMTNCATDAGTIAAGIPAANRVGTITLTVNPFTNAGSGDFSLNTTAGGGALLRGTGYGTFPISTTAYPDVGAAQHQDGGGAVGSVIRSAMIQGARA